MHGRAPLVGVVATYLSVTNQPHLCTVQADKKEDLDGKIHLKRDSDASDDSEARKRQKQ